MCVDKGVRFEYAVCGRGKKKLRIKKYPDMCGGASGLSSGPAIYVTLTRLLKNHKVHLFPWLDLEHIYLLVIVVFFNFLVMF